MYFGGLEDAILLEIVIFLIPHTIVYIQTRKYTLKCLKFPPPLKYLISIESSLINFKRQNNSNLCARTVKCSLKRDQAQKEMLTLMVKFVKIAKIKWPIAIKLDLS